MKAVQRMSALGAVGIAMVLVNGATSPAVADVVTNPLVSLRPSTNAGLVVGQTGKTASDNTSPELGLLKADASNRTTWQLDVGKTEKEVKYYLFKTDKALCLNVQGASAEDSAPIIAYACGTDDNELWSVVDQGNGYQIVNKLSGKCLAIKGEIEAGTALVQQTCAPGKSVSTWLLTWNPA